MDYIPLQNAIIPREPDIASRTKFDLIVVGGGIYGVMIFFEATRRKIKTLLIEKNDFGSGTSFNWLRILHGGLRYLQHADLKRFFESVNERSWFLRTFPHLVCPLPCLMPLYGKGLRRPIILRLAVMINDLLSLRRNKNIPVEKHIANGRIISLEETLERAPGIHTEGLKGGVIWYDAIMPESPILIKEVLRWCVGRGAMVLNYTAASKLILNHRKVEGVKAEDLVKEKHLEFYALKVVNAAGPWCRQVASVFDCDRPALFPYSKAWNVLFDRQALAQSGLAVAPDQPNARTYFLFPWKGRLMAGTGHVPCQSSESMGRPTNKEMDNFIRDINKAVPGLQLKHSHVKRVFHGLLPSVRQGSAKLADRAMLLDHGNNGGPEGLFSVSGVKFTTARLVAEKTVRRLFPKSRILIDFDSRTLDQPIQVSMERCIFKGNGNKNAQANDGLLKILENIYQSESVMHLHDLVFRRTNLWENPDLALRMCSFLCQRLQMSKNHMAMEIEMINRLLKNENVS
jgi:glycerol-3-phosphate dehydrogenase